MTHSGGKPHTNVGDKGQRYEVRGELREGQPANGQLYEVVGWTDKADGGSLLRGAEAWPRYKKAYVIDREQNEHV